uniref:Large ribosomal subunit protein uL16m n=1 Tax=Chlorokybus atmophyticus TaxID=3144 RepID=A6YEA7_CHLAT|nr:ribosomal protein L16 [Chlorokybus atmophyticus]ABO15110.1 ribosomal protein L16 [Chlorokybus atmophyticus]
MLSPKRTKFRKYQKGRVGGIRMKGGCSGSLGVTGELCFGKFGLKCVESGRLSSRVIEATRRAITRKLKRKGQVWVRIFPDIPVSGKPAEVRMGKGKGNPAYWVSRVQKGQVLFELDRVPEVLAKQAVLKGSHKLPLKSKFLFIK